ncbi:17337_t:CDS:2 [Rhizophagus irregularis]|nr:17337_t:CDS:2 [Rhizophagus irregularis]
MNQQCVISTPLTKIEKIFNKASTMFPESKKILQAIWVDGPINNWNMIRYGIYNIVRENNYIVVLKKLKGNIHGTE